MIFYLDTVFFDSTTAGIPVPKPGYCTGSRESQRSAHPPSLRGGRIYIVFKFPPKNPRNFLLQLAKAGTFKFPPKNPRNLSLQLAKAGTFKFPPKNPRNFLLQLAKAGKFKFPQKIRETFRFSIPTYTFSNQ